MREIRFRQTSLIALCLSIAASPWGALAQPRAADEIGVTTATNPATRGTPPQRPTRVLHIGTNVISRERVQSTGSGSAQLLFFDRSSLTVGPNSDLVLDEFVYNPATNSGRMAATLTRGVMRFVGGQISHQGNVSITTPTATIGVRGGAVLLRVDAAGGTEVKVNYGQASVVSRLSGESQRVMRPNFGVTVSASGAVSPPTRFTAEDLVQITALLHSAPGQSGGALERPTDERAQGAGVGRANANVLARSGARSGLLDDLQIDTRTIITNQLNTNRTVVVTVVAPATSPPPPAASPPPPPVVELPPPPPPAMPPPPPPAMPPPPPPSEDGEGYRQRRGHDWHARPHSIEPESRSASLRSLPASPTSLAPPARSLSLPAALSAPAASLAAPARLSSPISSIPATLSTAPVRPRDIAPPVGAGAPFARHPRREWSVRPPGAPPGLPLRRP
jgi:hypothetical protein